MIPADEILLDGDRAWWVWKASEAFDEETGEDYIHALDRPCDTPHCNKGHDMRFDGGHSRPCSDCKGTGRHTFELQVERPADGWHPERTGDPDCKCRACTDEACWQFHPFGEDCDHDSVDRHADRECDDPELRTYRVSVVRVLPIAGGDLIGVPRPVIHAHPKRLNEGTKADRVEQRTYLYDVRGQDDRFVYLPPEAKPGQWAVELAVSERAGRSGE